MIQASLVPLAAVNIIFMLTDMPARVLTFQSFQDNSLLGKSDKTRVSSITVGIQQAGALVGCFVTACQSI